MAETTGKGQSATEVKGREQTPANQGQETTALKPGEPFEIAVLALQNTTLFPETVVPLAVGRPRSVAAV